MVSGDRSNKIAINFESDRCLYSRSTWTSCSLCVDSCPVDAIQPSEENKPPIVDIARCMQCGQCLSACPLEAFESSSFSERQLFSRIEPEGDIRLHCFLPHAEYASLRSGLNTYQLGTCLAALTPGALFELSLSRTCELSTDQCQQCTLFPRVGKTMECNETSAFLLLSDWGKSGNLKETTELFLPEACDDTKASDGAEIVGDSAQNETDTKGCFDGVGTMRSSIRSLFHGRRKKANAAKAPLPLKAKKRRTPSWRMRLKSHWEHRDRKTTETCPWPVLVVDENRCKACGICMQLCPTGSIHQTLSEGTFMYSVVPGACVNCGLCIASCSSKALSRDYRAAAHPFDELESCSQDAVPCIRCGLPVLSSQGGQHCHLCLSEPDPATLAERVKKQMRALKKARESKNLAKSTALTENQG